MFTTKILCGEFVVMILLHCIGSPAEGSSIHERSFRQNGRNRFQSIEIVATSDACGVTGSVSRDVIRGIGCLTMCML